ncbi:DUF2160 family membrane protein [Carboxydochorda subterranea]|uniref:DUF2160 family membrane protein n=1 Tax=Carboxydichorda subterranea TaxID=3109565 RepID=A0ABZ1BXT3_9FIRM|nr:DUF2160 family membrane protein [Limnochorda sp. L945t]WRP17315.1 DUF2160 family membrane protein [Limnochorda sp. L945t]
MSMPSGHPARRAGWQPPSAGGSKEPRPPGWLRMETNLFDRIFIGGVLFVAIHLLWMRFVEAYVPLGLATVLSLALMAAIIRWG